MKKLLFIAIATGCACAFAFELAPTATFERFEAGHHLSVLDADVDGDSTYWDFTNSDQLTGVVRAYAGKDGADDESVAAPEDIYGNVVGSNMYLHVDSGSDTLLRHATFPDCINDTYTYDSPALGVYVDCYTQFTAAEAKDSLENSDKDKLRLYLLREDDEYVFHITAGFFDATLGNFATTPTDYAVTFDGITPAENTWYRLTIKTLANITGDNRYVPAFIVYLDEVPAVNKDAKGTRNSFIDELDTTAKAYNRLGQLFPSMVAASSGGDARNLVGIGFQGSGCVDNIAFAEAEDFEAENEFAMDIEAVPALSVSFDGGDTKGYEYFADVFKDATKTNATSVAIAMNEDASLPDIDISDSYSIAIDLNGYDITNSVNIYAGDVTFTNSAATASVFSGGMILNMGTLTMGAGELTVDSMFFNYGSLTLLSGKYKTKPTTTGADVAEYYNPDGLVLIKGSDGYYALGESPDSYVVTDSDGSSFTMPTSVMDSEKANTTVPGKSYNYAQAYVLGLYDAETEEVTGDPVVTISVVDGEVTVKLEAGELVEGYVVSYTLWGCDSLAEAATESGWTQVSGSVVYGASITEQVGDKASRFYKVKVVITDAE